MITKFRVRDEGVQIAPEESAVQKAAKAFREALRPFGLDKFMLSDVPERILTFENGRVLAEFRTMMFPVWYPEKVIELRAAGLDVVTVRRQYKTHPPQMMYYVRSVQEIGGNDGNQ